MSTFSSARDHREQSNANDDASAHNERHEAPNEDCITDKAKKLWYSAEQWRNNNPSAWGFIVQLCLMETEHKRRFGMKWAIEEVRKKSFATNDGERFKICNTYAPVFSRMLVKEHPEVTPYIVLKSSMIDELMA